MSYFIKRAIKSAFDEYIEENLEPVEAFNFEISPEELFKCLSHSDRHVVLAEWLECSAEEVFRAVFESFFQEPGCGWDVPGYGEIIAPEPEDISLVWEGAELYDVDDIVEYLVELEIDPEDFLVCNNLLPEV